MQTVLPTPRLTKIVATIGPATETEEILTDLVEAGMNVARFNTKHGTPDWHQERIQRVKNVSKELDTPVATLLDLQGPEIRINVPGEGSFDVEAGEEVYFTSKDEADVEIENFAMIPQEVIDALEIDDHVIVEDGLCNFTVSKVEDDGFFAAALDSFNVAHRKTMNMPGVTIDMPSLIPEDLEKLDFVKDMELEYVALSFVRTAEDIEALRAELAARNMESDIVAKIENQSALDHLEEIINASDAVMVARGDLGVEVPFEQLIFWQKEIINRCRSLGKPVITATQMLESMVNEPLPTRAEVSDVAHAVYDGTDAVMLSGETTIGKYPVKTVETQARIAHFNEQYTNLSPDLESIELDTTAAAMTDAVIDILDQTSQEFDKVVVLTETGRSAQLLSRYRTKMPVHAVTSTEMVRNKMALLYGVSSHVIPFEAERMGDVDYIGDMLKTHGVAKDGEHVLLVHGKYWTEPGKISSLTAIEI